MTTLMERTSRSNGHTWIRYVPKASPRAGREPAIMVGGKGPAKANMGASAALQLEKCGYSLFIDSAADRMGFSIGTADDVFRATIAGAKGSGAFGLSLVKQALTDMGLWPEKRVALLLRKVTGQLPIVAEIHYGVLRDSPVRRQP